ncbi:hypothetical protein JKP88DRAFT_241300 [Tribonema minus]|uniref:Uncharacterized protein n=1 Tax=Tribonema minus TaxID=303371 RepID=A0A836CE29_9STRA|nr:hypothetical protein JKP88DRAFT_241300 [Tribonema minus]
MSSHGDAAGKGEAERMRLCRSFMAGAGIGQRVADPPRELEAATKHLRTRQCSYCSDTLADFVRFAGAARSSAESESEISSLRASVVEYCKAVRAVAAAEDCSPGVRRLLDAIVGTLLAWRPRDSLHDTMAGLLFRKCFLCCSGGTRTYTLQSFFGKEAVDTMRSKVRADRARDPNAAVLEFLSAPKSENEIRTEVLRACFAIADDGDASPPQGFAPLFDARNDDVWAVIGARVYGCRTDGGPSGDEIRWRALVSELTGDADCARGLVAILLFMLYFPHLGTSEEEEEDDEDEVEGEEGTEGLSKAEGAEVEATAEATAEAAAEAAADGGEGPAEVPDIAGWARDKMKIVKEE